MKLVKGRGPMSDEFRKGLWEGKKRIAGVGNYATSDDELLGLIFVFETVLASLKSQLAARRRKRKQNFKLELV